MKKAAADPVRREACLALHAVLHEGRSLNTDFESLENDAQGRARCRALVYTACRWQPRLSAVLNQLVQKPFRRRDARVSAVVLVALTELEYLDAAPHAVVDSAVSLVVALGHAPLRGLVNAVLRRYLRERETVLAAVDADPAVKVAHPNWLYKRLKADWPDAVSEIVSANNTRGPMTLRVPMAVGRGHYRDRLLSAGVSSEFGPGETDLVLDQPVDVGTLPGFSDGECSVQDSAAQFAAQLVAPQPSERVLDACAAPGGKTGHLIECGATPSQLTALDASAERLKRVEENVQRLGAEGVRMAVADAQALEMWWDGVPFDAVLLDAPCTGLGVIRRHPDIKVLRRASDIDQLAALQSALLDALWTTIKPGGRLVYATCSVARRENDQQVDAFLARTSDAREMSLTLPVGRAASRGWQILPGEMGCDGFYYACIHRLPGAASA